MPEGFAVADCPPNTNEVTARGVGTARGEEIRFCCAAEPTPSISAYGGAMRLGEHCARAGNLPLLPSPIQSSHGGFPLFDGHRHPLPAGQLSFIGDCLAARSHGPGVLLCTADFLS